MKLARDWHCSRGNWGFVMRNIVKTTCMAAVGILGLALATSSAQAATINLSATVRDFCGWGFSGCPAGYAANPDFENAIADDHGIVKTTLGADGTPDYAGGAHGTLFGSESGYGTQTTAQYFSQWYHDTPGFNQSTTINLALNDIGGGIYEYSNSSFFPIDGQLLGNQGQGNNFAFTAQLSTAFTYAAGQTFSFTGDDDVWVFINNQLVIDLGGVHGAEGASVALDTLGLTVGNDYNLDFFFAERHTSQSNMKIDTSIVLRDTTTDVPEPVTLSVFGAGIAGAIAMRRRKKKLA